MPTLKNASPGLSVRLYKTISRTTVDGETPVSSRYAGKDDFIDLTPSLGDGSSVRTSKNVREPAGSFAITFTDKPHGGGSWVANLESKYGLIEPMDMIEIRMWRGTGPAPRELPIIMRGFVSEISRSEMMADDGKPSRTVTVSGHDFGKIWQTYQIIYLAAYSEGQPLLTNYALWEMFGVTATNAMPAGEFVRTMIEKVINPHLDKMLPPETPMPRKIQTGDSISVKRGVVSGSYQEAQGSIYEILASHGDVGVWNELYVEDRADGVHCVYRAIPAKHLTAPKGANGKAQSRLIQDDAIEPPTVIIPVSEISSIAAARADAVVANFFWVNNTRFDLVDDMQRKLASIPQDDGRVSIKDYANAGVRYYGVRMMQASTQQADDGILNMGSGLDENGQETRSKKQESWIDYRRRMMIEMNRDNVVFERGTARVKGGPMRPDGVEAMKAGDYAQFQRGTLSYEAYVVQIDHEFVPYQGYTTTLAYERSTGFVARTVKNIGADAPWLAEQSSRGG